MLSVKFSRACRYETIISKPNKNASIAMRSLEIRILFSFRWHKSAEIYARHDLIKKLKCLFIDIDWKSN